MQYKWMALAVTSVGVLMSGIDMRIVIVGLPTIAAQLHAGAAEAIWITQAYVVANTVFLLFVGRISDLFGRVKAYNVGFIIFTLGSALCAISPNAEQLIVFRIFQGMGAGIISGNSVAILTDSSPGEELGLMLGLNSTAWTVGGVLGLVLSGLILSVTDWRGLFYVNVPIGIFGTVWAYLKLREVSARDLSRKMDWWGFVLFSVGLTFALLAVTYLSYGPSGYLEGGLFLLIGVSMIVVFVIAESRTRFPLLDPKLFKIRLFAMSNIAQSLNALCWGASALIVAFYLQISLGYTPLESGLGIIPLSITNLPIAILSGRLSDKYGSRVLTTMGLVATSAGFILLSTFDATTPYPAIALSLIIIGAGNGLFGPPNSSAIMGSVPADRRGIAAGFRSTMYNSGIAVSYGLVVFLITLGIPYTNFSLLLQGIEPQSAISVANTEFLSGFRIVALALAAIAASAIVPSAMRGRKMIERLSPEKETMGNLENAGEKSESVKELEKEEKGESVKSGSESSQDIM